jgi:hypothetical protein
LRAGPARLHLSFAHPQPDPLNARIMNPTTTATASAGVSRTRARSLPGFHLGLAALMAGIVVLGFWPFYAGLFTGSAAAHPVIYAHAAIFSGWLVLLLAQTWLVFRRRVGAHQRLGRFGIAYGAAVVLLGFVTAFSAPALNVNAGRMTLDQAAGFLILPIGDMLLFAGFFTVGILARRNRETHRRLMVLAAVALIFPGAARFAGDAGVLSVLGLWLAPLAAAMAHDLYTTRRVHRVYWIGAIICFAAISRVALMDAEPWLVIGRRMLRPFVS